MDEVRIEAVAEGAAPRLMVSEDGIVFEEAELTHDAGTTLYSASLVLSSGDYYYSRIYIQG